MDGCHNHLRERRWQSLASILSDPELFPEQGLGSRRAQGNDHPRLQQADLFLKPGIAGPHFCRSRLFVEPPAAFDRNKFEVLYCIRDVDSSAIDAGLFERRIEQSPSRPHEWMPLPVLLVSRLLADQHDLSVPRSLPEDRLSRVHPQITPSALLYGFTQLRQRWIRGDEISC